MLKKPNLFSWYYLLEILNTASKIFLIDIANILNKTKLIPIHPNNTEIDNKLEPRSRCKNSSIKNKIFKFTLIYIFRFLVTSI